MPRPVCPGDISTDVDGYIYCTSVGVPVTWQSVPEFDIELLDQADLAGFFAAGFVMVGISWAIGLSAAMILRAIQRA